MDEASDTDEYSTSSSVGRPESLLEQLGRIRQTTFCFLHSDSLEVWYIYSFGYYPFRNLDFLKISRAIIYLLRSREYGSHRLSTFTALQLRNYSCPS